MLFNDVWISHATLLRCSVPWGDAVSVLINMFKREATIIEFTTELLFYTILPHFKDFIRKAVHLSGTIFFTKALEECMANQGIPLSILS